MKRVFFAACALAVAFIAAYYLFFNEPNYDKLVSEAFAPYPNVISTSTRSEESPTKVDKVMALYDKQKYDEALRGFNEYLEENPSNHEVIFYRGITYMKMENSDLAISDFQQVIAGETRFSEQAEWYLGLALLKSKKKEAAAELFFSLADNKEHEYSEKANAIVNKIAYKGYMNEEIEAMN